MTHEASAQPDGDPGLPVGCVWTRDRVFREWRSSCGNEWTGLLDSPHFEQFQFCPYCGKPLIEQGEGAEK